MTRKQMCALAAVTAMLFLIGLAVWKLGSEPAEGSGRTAAILSSSIALYLMYLFSTLPGRNNTR
jgi:hypothetical protein